MTLDEILAGPVAERANGAPHLMTESEARGILLQIERQMSKGRRGKNVRNLAEHAARGIGRLSPEAINLYRAYAQVHGE